MWTLAELYTALAGNQWDGAVTIAGSQDRLTIDRVRKYDAIFTDASVAFGDVVLLAVDHSLDSIAAMVSAWAMGLVVSPLKQGLPANDIAKLAADCGAKLAVCPSDGTITRLSAPMPRQSRFSFTRPRRVCGSDLALIIYTSGSTGVPKGIMLTHSNVSAAVSAIATYLDLRSDDRILCVSPLTFDYGLYQLFLAFYARCHLVLLGRSFNPISCYEVIKSEKITVLPVVPAIASALLRTMQAFKRVEPLMRVVTNTGGHMPHNTAVGLSGVFPSARIFLMYGLTESKRALYLPPEDLARKPGSVGRPMPGLEAKVFVAQAAPDGTTHYREAAPNETGLLFVRGPSVMQGYTREQPGSGVEIVPGVYRDDNWLATGDLFMADDDGYLYFRGREKELIKQGGYCLFPREIEAAVERHPGVVMAAVVGKIEADGTETACLFIQTVTPDQEAVLHAWLAETIEPDYRPRVIRCIAEMPLSDNGKPNKKALLGQL